MKLDEAVRLGRNIINNVRAMKGSDQAPLYAFSDFLTGLSTVTDDYAAHLRERALNAGKTAEEMRKKYGLPPRCERVSVRPHTPGDETDHICAYHGGTWPVEGKCPAAELEDIAALGDGRDEYGSVQP